MKSFCANAAEQAPIKIISRDSIATAKIFVKNQSWLLVVNLELNQNTYRVKSIMFGTYLFKSRLVDIALLDEYNTFYQPI